MEQACGQHTGQEVVNVPLASDIWDQAVDRQMRTWALFRTAGLMDAMMVASSLALIVMNHLRN